MSDKNKNKLLSAFSTVVWKKLSETQKKLSYLTFKEKVFQLPNNKKKTSLVAEQENFVCGLALTNNNKDVVCVMEYRPGPEKVFIDLPTGSLESKKEDPKDAMIRELKEETGYIPGEVILLNEMYVNPYSNAKRFSYLMLDCKQTNKNNPDKDEFVKPVVIPVEEFRMHVQNGHTLNGITFLLGMNHLEGMMR